MSRGEEDSPPGGNTVLISWGAWVGGVYVRKGREKKKSSKDEGINFLGRKMQALFYGISKGAGYSETGKGGGS